MSKHFFPRQFKSSPERNPFAGFVERRPQGDGYLGVVFLGLPLGKSMPIMIGTYPTMGAAAKAIAQCQEEVFELDQAEDDDSYTSTRF
jgi:hypothetical protein